MYKARVYSKNGGDTLSKINLYDSISLKVAAIYLNAGWNR